MAASVQPTCTKLRLQQRIKLRVLLPRLELTLHVVRLPQRRRQPSRRASFGEVASLWQWWSSGLFITPVQKKKGVNYIAHLGSSENNGLHQVGLLLHRPSKRGVSGARREFQRDTHTSIFPSP
jgi:hypothetical protein